MFMPVSGIEDPERRGEKRESALWSKREKKKTAQARRIKASQGKEKKRKRTLLLVDLKSLPRTESVEEGISI